MTLRDKLIALLSIAIFVTVAVLFTVNIAIPLVVGPRATPHRVIRMIPIPDDSQTVLERWEIEDRLSRLESCQQRRRINPQSIC